MKFAKFDLIQNNAYQNNLDSTQNFLSCICPGESASGKFSNVHRDTVSRSYKFGDCFLASSFGLDGITTNAIQPRQVVHSGSNFQKSSHQTDRKYYLYHSV